MKLILTGVCEVSVDKCNMCEVSFDRFITVC